LSAADFVLQRVPQSASTVQLTVGSFAQVLVAVSHVLTGRVQVTNPSLPHVERAAQRVTLPLQLVGMAPWCASSRTLWATQLTY